MYMRYIIILTIPCILVYFFSSLYYTMYNIQKFNYFLYVVLRFHGMCMYIRKGITSGNECALQ
jgi:hypothetical protein